MQVMTFTASKCVHNLPQTSIVLGKLIRRPVRGASLTNPLIKCLTTHPGSLFYMLLAIKLFASAWLTAAQTKQCADKLLNTTTNSTATPATGLEKFEGDGFLSLCSPAGRFLVRTDGIHDRRSWMCGQEVIRSPVCA